MVRAALRQTGGQGTGVERLGHVDHGKRQREAFSPSVSPSPSLSVCLSLSPLGVRRMNGYLSQSAASVLFHHLSLLALSFLCKDVRPVCHSLHPACLSSFLPIPSSLCVCVFFCVLVLAVCVCVYHVPDHYLSPPRHLSPSSPAVCVWCESRSVGICWQTLAIPSTPPSLPPPCFPSTHTQRVFCVCFVCVCACMCVAPILPSIRPRYDRLGSV